MILFLSSSLLWFCKSLFATIILYETSGYYYGYDLILFDDEVLCCYYGYSFSLSLTFLLESLLFWSWSFGVRVGLLVDLSLCSLTSRTSLSLFLNSRSLSLSLSLSYCSFSLAAFCSYSITFAGFSMPSIFLTKIWLHEKAKVQSILSIWAFWPIRV